MAPRVNDDTLIYLNQVVGLGRAVEPGGATVQGVLAQVETQRGGAIVGDGLDYYVGLQRLVLNTRLPTLIGEMALPSPNGTKLVYSLTISTATSLSQQYFELDVPPAKRVLWTTQPPNEYAFVDNLAGFVAIFNDALGRAWEGVGGEEALVPFVEIVDCENRLRMVFPDYEGWAAERREASPPPYELFFNIEALAVLAGWPTKLLTKPGEARDPDGKDVQMLVSRDSGAAPLPPFDSPALYPASGPTPGQAISVCMQAPVTLPAMRFVRVICSLPSQPELVAGGRANDQTKRIFADLSLEGAQRLDGDALVFNGFVNSGTRWVRLTQSGPITGFSTTIELTDWLGRDRVCRFLSPLESATCKYVFCPASLIRNYPADHQFTDELH